MRILALCGSARRLSTNAALLRALARLAPAGVEIEVFEGIGALPVFSPDLEAEPPPPVRDYIARVDAAQAMILASPEYARAIPGGLKNAIDWLVSRDALVAKPIALAHASHRGDDMLASLRVVLATVSARFAPDVFLRLELMKRTPEEIADVLAQPEIAGAAQAFLDAFVRFARTG